MKQEFEEDIKQISLGPCKTFPKNPVSSFMFIDL